MIVAMSIPLARIAVSDRILHVLESDTLRHFSRTPVLCRPLTSPLFLPFHARSRNSTVGWGWSTGSAQGAIRYLGRTLVIPTGERRERTAIRQDIQT